VNWPREGGDEAVSNPLWDTHAQNADRLQDVLCPQFDVTFTALIEDLEQRGMLAETLVVAVGEFGRTPKINPQGGRDHWGHVFSLALAGAGISGARVYGSSDKHGAYPRDGQLEPQDLSATILHLLGVGHSATFPDLSGRPQHATLGEPLYALLGDRPATAERTVAQGNLALVPPFTKDVLLSRGFEEQNVLTAVGAGKRWKGWQGTPLASPPTGDAPGAVDFGVALADRDTANFRPRSGKRQALVGFGLSGPSPAGAIPPGARAILTQEVRNPRAGTYMVSAHLRAGGTRTAVDLLRANFGCRMVLFGYRDLAKNLLSGMREYVSVPIEIVLETDTERAWQKTTLSRALRSQDAGASEIEMGVGVAILLERTTPGELPIPSGSRAYLAFDDVEILFTPRPRNDDVTV
jgi:hypothetical protein